MVIIMIVISVMKSMGLADIFWAIGSMRRTRVEEEPRDHVERWISSHRKSSKDNKPRSLNWIWTTGDKDTPKVRIGKIVGIEPWKNNYIIYVRNRKNWVSIPFIAPREICTDINRKNLWVECLGFSSAGPYRIPIPRAKYRDIMDFVLKTTDGFRASFETQIHNDIMEDMAWDISTGMAPPYEKKIRSAEVQSPNYQMREYRQGMDEE